MHPVVTGTAIVVAVGLIIGTLVNEFLENLQQPTHRGESFASDDAHFSKYNPKATRCEKCGREVPNDDKKHLSCGHLYHSECIKSLKKCPSCKTK